MNTKMKQQSGFTLIELMIVVGIVGIIAAIAIPSYQDQIRKARRADVMDALTDCAAVQARNFSTASPPSYLAEDDIEDQGLCNGLNSKDGYYGLEVTNDNCTTGNTVWCFQISAEADADRSQAKDTSCAVWTIDYRGNQTSQDPAGADTTALCWRS